jgi:integrase
MPTDRLPSYRRKKTTGGVYAVVTLPDGLGRRRDVLLGKWRSKESRTEYARVLAEWEAAGRCLPESLADAAGDLTINELILRFWKHVADHYRRADGTPTTEVSEYKQALRPLRRLYGDTVLKNFGPLALKAVREAMVTGSWLTEAEKTDRKKNGKKITWCRGVVNDRVARIKRMFRWAVENELVKSDVLHALEAVKGLERGRSAARETEPIKPVNIAFVEATLPYAPSTVADMTRLQLVSGMRPGEVCKMRGIDLDTTGPVWLYRPDQHKTAHLGYTKVVALGPQAQEIIRRNLKLDVEAYIFSPRDVVEQHHAERRAARQSPITPSQAQRTRRHRPKRTPGEYYRTSAYGCAIRRAIVRANKARAQQGLPPIPDWHLHQLRHTKATEIRREEGLDAARAVLGHRSPAVTEVYAELDLGKAIEVAAKLG